MTPQEYFKDWWRIIPIEELNNVLTKLHSLDDYYPNNSNVFKAFSLCSYSNVSIVFLGQDPYFDGCATGVAFGVNGEKIPPSLEVIKEACIDYTLPHYELRFDNSLESWAKQGILMLNSALTVEYNKAGSHMMLWRKFISQLLSRLSSYNPGLIYVLFGEQAQTFEPYINKNNTIIKVKHPAFYARTHTKMPNIFRDINSILYADTGKVIEWFSESKYGREQED